MKLAILLATGLSALALSGCVEERRGYGGGYGYERSTVVIGEDRGYRRGNYRDDRRRDWDRDRRRGDWDTRVPGERRGGDREVRRANRDDDGRGRGDDRGDRRRGGDNGDNNRRY